MVFASSGVLAPFKGVEFGLTADNKVFLSFLEDAGSEEGPLISGKAYPSHAGEWHQYTATYDRGSRRRTLYRDGAPIASSVAGNALTTSAPVTIGRGVPGSALSSFDGDLDNFRLYSTVFSPTEVAQMVDDPDIEITRSQGTLVRLTCQSGQRPIPCPVPPLLWSLSKLFLHAPFNYVSVLGVF